MTPVRQTLSTLALTLALTAPGLAQTAPAADAAPPPADAAAPAADPTAPAAGEAAQAAGDAAGAPATTAVPPAADGDISGTYSFDPEHSQIVFTYEHMGFSTSHGMVNGVTGSVTLDKANPEASTVEASFPLSAIRTIAASLDTHLMSDDFFKGAAPDTPVTFRSTAVKMGDDDDEAEVTGDLTLNGVTRPVTLEVELKKAAAHPMTGKPAVGFDIETKLKRSDFNLGAFAPAVSDEVEIDIAVEASK